MASLHRWLADLVLILHLGLVLFVVGGLLLIVAGNLLARWPWVNGWPLRCAHLATIAVVVAQSWLGLTCPLTTLESWLRLRAGMPGYGPGQGFIAHGLQRLLFYNAPDWVFTLLYSSFGLLVVAAWCYFPPRAGTRPSPGDAMSDKPAKMTLQFSITIQAPRERVWRTLLELPTYRQWTAAFAPGSTYEGSWEQGQSIRFLAPGAGGMVARIAANRAPEFVSIEHLGMVDAEGVEDRDSEAVRAWLPAFENYTLLAPAPGLTELRIDMDVTADYEQMMRELWPKALAALKVICEAPSAA
ncbi:MAG TPA: DUF2784 family protein [Roseateles sp.]|nr:DUF2784 family protein [Roseateles sp.]